MSGNLEGITAALEQAAQPDTEELSGLFVDAAAYVEQEPPPSDAIVPELFDTGDKVALIGSSKARKSFFAMELALCIATGREIVGLPIAKRRRVLLIQYEIKPTHFHRRLHRAAKAYGIDADELRGWLVIVNGRGNTKARDFARLAELAKAEVLILDPLYKLMTGDENDSEAMAQIFATFDQVSEQTGAAVVFVHHDKKGITGDRDERDRGSGHGTLGRDYDTALFLSEHATQPDLIVLSKIVRNYPPQPKTAIRWQDGRFFSTDEEAVERTTHTVRQQQRTRGRKPCPDAVEIVQRLEGLSDAMTTEKVDKLIRDMGGTKREAEDVRKELLAEGQLEAWRPAMKHAPTYIGTPGQIDRKRAEIEAKRQKELPT
jgi:RecA-family ATPase